MNMQSTLAFSGGAGKGEGRACKYEERQLKHLCTVWNIKQTDSMYTCTYGSRLPASFKVVPKFLLRSKTSRVVQVNTCRVLGREAWDCTLCRNRKQSGTETKTVRLRATSSSRSFPGLCSNVLKYKSAIEDRRLCKPFLHRHTGSLAQMQIQ
jgi:hypothetical protein